MREGPEAAVLPAGVETERGAAVGADAIGEAGEADLTSAPEQAPALAVPAVAPDVRAVSANAGGDNTVTLDAPRSLPPLVPRL